MSEYPKPIEWYCDEKHIVTICRNRYGSPGFAVWNTVCAWNGRGWWGKPKVFPTVEAAYQEFQDKIQHHSNEKIEEWPDVGPTGIHSGTAVDE